MYTQRPGFRDKKGRFGFVNSSNKLAKYAEDNKMKIGEFSEVFSLDVGFVIIQLNNIDPERKNTFEEALPKISNIVQDEITKWIELEWNKKLEKEYPLKIDNKLLNEIFKK